MYSKMIREGQITREDALNRIQDDHKPRMKKLGKNFEELGVTKEQVDESLKKCRKRLLWEVLAKQHDSIEII